MIVALALAPLRHHRSLSFWRFSVTDAASLSRRNYWRLISFSAGESLMVSENKIVLVPLETLMHTVPLAFTYLVYMLVAMESVRVRDLSFDVYGYGVVFAANITTAIYLATVVRIGAKLLGVFGHGMVQSFINAKTLTPAGCLPSFDKYRDVL